MRGARRGNYAERLKVRGTILEIAAARQRERNAAGGTKRTAGDSADRDGEEGEGEVRDEVLASSGLVGASGRVDDGRGKSGGVEDGKAAGEEDARKGHRRGSLTGERRWEGASSSPSCLTSFPHDARRGSVSAAAAAATAAAAALGGGAPSKAG